MSNQKFNENQCKQLLKAYKDEFKKIQPYESTAKNRRELRNQTLRDEYIRDIVKYHNDVVNYLRITYRSYEKEEAQLKKIRDLLGGLLSTTRRAFVALFVEYTWTNNAYDTIKPDLVRKINKEKSLSSRDLETSNNFIDIDTSGDISSSASSSTPVSQERQTVGSETGARSRTTQQQQNLTDRSSIENQSVNNLYSGLRQQLHEQSQSDANINAPNVNNNPTNLQPSATENLNNLQEQTPENLANPQENNRNDRDETPPNNPGGTDNTDNNQNRTPPENRNTGDGNQRQPPRGRNNSENSEDEVRNMSENGDDPPDNRELSILNKTITTTYNGDSKALNRFIASIRLADRLINDKQLLIDYIITKLEDRAADAIPADPNTVEEIIESLKEHIKPKPSAEIESSILALRMDGLSLGKFTKRAEFLANELRRSLVNEGHTDAKARESAVMKTKEMCRKQTGNSYVKSVIQSTPFTTPSEVVSALVIELENAKQDRKDAEMSKNQRKFNNNRGNSRGRGRGGYNNYNGNHSNRHHENNHNNGHNNNRNNNNNNNRGGYRGRGRGNYNNYNNGGYNNRNGQNEHNIRYFQGNVGVPPQSGGVPQFQWPAMMQQPATQQTNQATLPHQ